MTIQDIMRANEAAGRFFFEPDTMRFFRCSIVSEAIEGRGHVVFVTLDKTHADDESEREYSIREFFPDSGEVERHSGPFARWGEVRRAVRDLTGHTLEHAAHNLSCDQYRFQGVTGRGKRPAKK